MSNTAFHSSGELVITRW